MSFWENRCIGEIFASESNTVIFSSDISNFEVLFSFVFISQRVV